MFEDGNVCVCGLRGRGKDMLFANVIWRRKLPYISNVNYGGEFNAFNPMEFDCGGNSYKNFISNDVKKYVYPYADGIDIYVSDSALLFPAHFCNELNKLYPFFPNFFALTRQLGEFNFHINVQNLNRVWDKIREQSDLYIMCNRCFVIFGWVLQCVTIYELYDSAVKRVPPFRIRKPLFNPERRFQWEMAYQNYMISHGEIKRKWLLYKNFSNYNTRIFKEVLENGKVQTS